MKNYILTYILLALGFITSCSDTDSNTLPGGVTDNLKEGFTYLPETPDADQPLTITFKASPTSALYGYAGDVYLHTGIVSEGVWLYVPADWNENIEKCKFTKSQTEANVWTITLSPSIREWFASGTTPVEQLGIIIRSADGSKKGIDKDQFVNVTDMKYHGFVPGKVQEKSLPSGVQEGINLDIDNCTVTLVLYDKATDGSHKDYAYVVGDFNEWTLANDETSQMYRDEATGCWWITISDLDPAKEYRFQYYVGTLTGDVMRLADPYSEKILDPDNDKYIAASTYPVTERQYPDKGIGIVSVFKLQREEYSWINTDFKIKDADNMMIYEMLLRDFTETGDLNGAIQKLDYLQALGINAVELMPVQEFDGNNSWGYNPCFFFALDKAYGTKEMYKRFIDECHSRGIAVLFDVVYNHATGNMPYARLYWNNSKGCPAANNPWFNEAAPHPFSVFNDFNHESELTRRFVKRNLKFLLDEYKIDGFRFDLTKGFTNKTSNEGTSGNYDASRVAILKDYYLAIKEVNPDAIMICEHLAGIEEESELSQIGMKLWRNMNNAYCQSAMGWSEGSGFTGLTTFNTTMKEGGWVGYMESHDEERCAYKQTQWGNGLLQTDLSVQMQQLEANAAFFFMVSGPKMIWQFGELGYDISRDANQQGEVISGEDHKTDPKPVLWSYKDIPERNELYTTYSRLLALRKAYPDVFGQDAFKEWRVSDNDWNDGRYIRLETVDGKQLVVVGNFTDRPVDMQYVFPVTGEWYNFCKEGMPEIITATHLEVPAHSFGLYTNFSIPVK